MGEVELAWRRSRSTDGGGHRDQRQDHGDHPGCGHAGASGVRAVAAGNIGVPLLDAVAGDAEVIVAEVSSFQLALTETFRPAVGAWVNFSEDHLDWHATRRRLPCRQGPGVGQQRTRATWPWPTPRTRRAHRLDGPRRTGVPPW